MTDPEATEAVETTDAEAVEAAEETAAEETPDTASGDGEEAGA